MGFCYETPRITTKDMEQQLRGIEKLTVEMSKVSSALAYDASEVSIATVLRLIDDSDDMWINAATGNTWAPLHSASRAGLDAVVLRLLERGANTSAVTFRGHVPEKKGETALQMARAKGHMATARLLVDWGVDDRRPIHYFWGAFQWDD